MNESVNLLVIATIAGTQAEALTRRLTADGFFVTRLDSSGGILLESSTSLLIGLDRAHLPHLIALFRECCRRRRQIVPAHVEILSSQMQPPMIEVEVGGAMLYALNVERFEQL